VHNLITRVIPATPWLVGVRLSHMWQRQETESS
jgi:hypothetical protein